MNGWEIVGRIAVLVASLILSFASWEAMGKDSGWAHFGQLMGTIIGASGVVAVVLSWVAA